MDILYIGGIAAAAACASMALLQLLIWAFRRKELEHLSLALASFAAVGLAISEVRMSHAGSIEEFVDSWKLSNYSVGILFLGLTWFVVVHSGTKPGLLSWVAGGGWIAGLAINFARPLGLSLDSVSGLVQETAPWGETYTVANASTDLTKLIPDVAAISFILLAGLRAARMWKGGRPQSAAVLGLLSGLMTVALVHTTLVDLGLIASPYLIGFTFLFVVLLTNLQVAARVAAASVLADRVREGDARWRTLLDGVQLLVVRLDQRGTIEYVNPYFCEVSGYSSGDVLGREYLDLVAEEDRARIRQAFEAALASDPRPKVEALLSTHSGERRSIVWRNVILRDSEGRPLEILSVGVDITDRRNAETERDRASEEIQDLKEQLEAENLYLKEEIQLQSGSSDLIGESDPLRYVLFKVERVAPTATTVLIQGETGVGKELVARAIHQRSDRAREPFVRLNCSALTPSLVEAELFGHVAGAFTDAKAARKGRFEMADGGTLFLDEVSELPREVQPKLLRVLQEGEFEPVGSSHSRKTDVRLIAATNRTLESEVQIGRFREDLFYRLHVYTITVPPLRDRKEDIPLLVRHFLPAICARTGRPVREVPSGVMRALQDYSWPGNVRQLQNVLEEAVVTCSDGILRLTSKLESPFGPEKNGFESLAENERVYIGKVLEATGGQVAGAGGAAEVLQIHPNTLRSRMKKLGL